MNDLGRAGEAMSEAESSLGEGNADSAVDFARARARCLAQGRAGSGAIDAAADGTRSRSRPQRPARPAARAAGHRSARPSAARARYRDDYTVKVPGEIDVQRARRIIEELRRRFGDVLRPQEELDYIERLLKDY